MVQQRVLMATRHQSVRLQLHRRVKEFLLQEGTDLQYGARHLKRAIERNIVFPLANLVATGQVKLGDFIRIDMDAEDKMIFVKEAEGALAPVLLERYGAAAAASPARRGRTAANKRRGDFGATPGPSVAESK